MFYCLNIKVLKYFLLSLVLSNVLCGLESKRIKSVKTLYLNLNSIFSTKYEEKNSSFEKVDKKWVGGAIPTYKKVFVVHLTFQLYF